MAKTNYYELLGLQPEASASEIKAAYRTLARKYHPDVNSSHEAESLFKEITKAYEALSDPGQRAHYDAGHHYNEPEDIARHDETQPDPRTREKHRRAQFRAAYTYIVLWSLIFGLIGLGINWLVVKYSQVSLTAGDYKFMFFIIGVLAGAILVTDKYFKMESFLGVGKLGRSYNFFRTAFIALAIGFFLSCLGFVLGSAFDFGARLGASGGLILGSIIGATLGSDGNFWVKSDTPEGRFEIIYSLLRGLEVAIMTGIVGFIFSKLMAVLGFRFTFPVILSSFVFGMIIGSTTHENLAAYAGYTSAYVRKFSVILFIFLALALGFVAGIWFKDIILKFFGL